jgi:hypothetical protein
MKLLKTINMGNIGLYGNSGKTALRTSLGLSKKKSIINGIKDNIPSMRNATTRFPRDASG